MKNLYFITSNKGKVREAREKLGPLGFSVIQKDLGYPEIQAEDLREVALEGVNHVRMRFQEPFMLEDAGLFIDSLLGFPGVYSKYVFFTIGLSGILRLLETEKKRHAVFKSVFAYHEPGGTPLIVIGECSGTITEDIRGKHGFGYDPIFIPDGAVQTFGEMTIAKKNTYSHRSKALDKLAEMLKNKISI